MFKKFCNLKIGKFLFKKYSETGSFNRKIRFKSNTTIWFDQGKNSHLGKLQLWIENF